jgi:hypothetical protein
MDRGAEAEAQQECRQKQSMGTMAVFTPVNKAGTGVIKYNSTGDLEDLGLILIDHGQKTERVWSALKSACGSLGVAAVLHI